MEVGLCTKQYTVICMCITLNHSNTVKVKPHIYVDGSCLVKVTGVTGVTCGTCVTGVSGVPGIQTQ